MTWLRISLFILTFNLIAASEPDAGDNVEPPVALKAPTTQPNQLKHARPEQRPTWLQPIHKHEKIQQHAVTTKRTAQPPEAAPPTQNGSIWPWVIGILCCLCLGLFFMSAKRPDLNKNRRPPSTKTPKSNITWACDTPNRNGYSMLEIMVAISILAVALVEIVGNVYSLDRSHRANQEVSRVHDILVAYGERLQGASWHLIGDANEPWSWHRVEGTDTPLSENAAAADDDLLSTEVGLLNDPSGVDNLRIWLEYRRMEVLDGITSASSWNTAIADNNNFIDPAAIDLTDFDDALVMRLVATWDSAIGAPRSTEIYVSRRK